MDPNLPTPPGDEAIEAQAAAWLVQREEGFAAGEREAFDVWRGADPRHERAMRSLEKAWTTMQSLRDFRPEARAHPDCDLLAPRRAPRQRSRSLLLRIGGGGLAAAAGCAAILLAISSRPKPGMETPPMHWSTQAGGYERCSLPDGSVAELNANTSLRWVQRATERRVVLDRGEAFFNVAKDAARPFRVEAGAVVLKAVGTAFNVHRQQDELTVLVTEGRVRLEPVARTARSPAGAKESQEGGTATQAAVESTSKHELGAGQQAVVLFSLPHEPRVSAVAPAQVRQVLAWQEPRLHFVDTPLADAVQRFNRANSVVIEFADPALGSVLVGGSFRPGSVETFVQLLVENGLVSVERPQPDRIVLHAVK